MMRVARGSSRTVFLTKRFAFKTPSVYSWRSFLNGMIANANECDFSEVEPMRDKLCPVLFRIPLGLLVVMPRCKEITPVEYSTEDLIEFCNQDDSFVVPAEIKHDSFGLLDGRLVAVDYG